MRKRRNRKLSILSSDVIKKCNEVCAIGNNGMLGIALLEFEIIKKRMDNWMGRLHKKTIAAK